MKTLYYISSLCFLSLMACVRGQSEKTTEAQAHAYTNHLAKESSPYLLQHAHNPVDWYPWGEEALEKAKRENKLIVVSIGYAACHWCHVMERESFEDEAVAKFMNDHFVAIKVDREERPDVDQVYMTAVQLLTGNGGWPLNCIALPDGRPLYGGTYFPKEQWLDVLKKIKDYVAQNPEKAEQQAKLLTEGVSTDVVTYEAADALTYTKTDLDTVFSHWVADIDTVYGGQKGAPKFPLPAGHQFLMHYYYSTQNKAALTAVTTALDQMANGGIYDQIGGGFARYATDVSWNVPHFEKMLYDNAQLVSLYSAAYQLTKAPEYKRVVKETLDFIDRELTATAGGFYASIDADSEGEEGKFYIWTKKAIEDVLGNIAEQFIDYYNVTEAGNWEAGKNILYKTAAASSIAEKHAITVEELMKNIASAKKKLFKARKKRVAPKRDDKILTSWNALMTKGYSDAYKAFGDEKYLEAALKNARFIRDKVKTEDHRLYRNYKDGKASINAFLDDYAFSTTAFIALYQVTFDETWLYEAKQLTDYALAHFYDQNSGMFYYTSDMDPALIARKIEVVDNVIPSANSEMAKNLFILGTYFSEAAYLQKSKKMLDAVKGHALEGAGYYANWDVLMAWHTETPYEVAIVGTDAHVRRKAFDQYYLPNVFLLGGKNTGSLELLENKYVPDQTTIYVCQNKTCKYPVTKVGEALKQLGL